MILRLKKYILEKYISNCKTGISNSIELGQSPPQKGQKLPATGQITLHWHLVWDCMSVVHRPKVSRESGVWNPAVRSCLSVWTVVSTLCFSTRVLFFSSYIHTLPLTKLCVHRASRVGVWAGKSAQHGGLRCAHQMLCHRDAQASDNMESKRRSSAGSVPPSTPPCSCFLHVVGFF